MVLGLQQRAFQEQGLGVRTSCTSVLARLVLDLRVTSGSSSSPALLLSKLGAAALYHRGSL